MRYKKNSDARRRNKGIRERSWWRGEICWLEKTPCTLFGIGEVFQKSKEEQWSLKDLVEGIRIFKTIIRKFKDILKKVY